MIGHLTNAMRLQALRTSAARTSSRIGFIQSYDPSNYAVQVELQPEGELTGWLSYAACWVGNGWGMFAPPTPGQRVTVELIDGDLDSGFAELALFDNANRPLEVQSGEFWLVHRSGAFFKLVNTGAIELSDTKGAAVTLDGSGNIQSTAGTWTHTGDLVVNGNINATQEDGGGGEISDFRSSMDTMRTQHNEHAHTGVQTGSGTSGTPTVDML